MSIAFGDAHVFPASEEVKKKTKELATKELFKDMKDAWALGAALGIALGKSHDQYPSGTFQGINTLDHDGVFAAIMLGLYPDLTPEERIRKLILHAEWGVREIYRREKNGTLDFSTLGIQQ